MYPILGRCLQSSPVKGEFRTIISIEHFSGGWWMGSTRTKSSLIPNLFVCCLLTVCLLAKPANFSQDVNANKLLVTYCFLCQPVLIPGSHLDLMPILPAHPFSFHLPFNPLVHTSYSRRSSFRSNAGRVLPDNI